MENKVVKVFESIYDFCIKYNFKYDFGNYIKDISNDLKIIINIEDDYLNLTIQFDNLKGEHYRIESIEKISIDRIKSFIYDDSLEETLSKLILHNISKIYNKLIFDGKNNLIYL